MSLDLLQGNPAAFIAWLAAIVLGITVHEFSHVLSAYVQGDDTGKSLGRLTLNPLAHIDFFGLLLLITAGFGWGKPAPYNPYQLRNPRLGSVLVALAGPLANLVFILFVALLFRFVLPFLPLQQGSLLVYFLVLVVQVNAVLMLFNLIPIPPLDGSRALLYLLPDRLAGPKRMLEAYGFVFLIGVIVMDSVTGGRLLGWLVFLISNVVDIALGAPS